MKRNLILTILIFATFSLGYGFKSIITQNNDKTSNMKKVTGIGGIFFKCKNPETMKAWYNKHLGLKTDAYGSSFEWRLESDSSKKGVTQWCPFPD